ncbi:type IV pilus biogenesis protein PilP [Paraburkholderia youngii]|uniref:type IV pilus biogenesis protein PilP n=1 Tax=Paraburkholderia youngii TaxID=2782701 RepID=UPI003D1D19D2
MKAKTLRIGLLTVMLTACAGTALAQPASGLSTATPGAPAQQPALATTAPPSRASSPAASTDLADLQAQIPVLQAKATIAELNARIAKATAEGGRGILPVSMPSSQLPVPSGGPLVITSPAQAATHAVRAEGGTEGMSVTSLTGFDGVYRAVINVGGVDQPAEVGASVGTGWTVKAVTGAGVTLVKGKQTVVLRG